MKANNYPNWLVPIEQAKKLKEIGFDEYCISYTRVSKKNEISGYIISVCHDPYDRMILGMRNKDHIDTNTTFGVSLPTWEQVFEWFMQKGLFGYVDKLILSKNKEVYKFYTRGANNTISDAFNSYEEAREALLKEMMKLLKK